MLNNILSKIDPSFPLTVFLLLTSRLVCLLTHRQYLLQQLLTWTLHHISDMLCKIYFVLTVLGLMLIWHKLNISWVGDVFVPQTLKQAKSCPDSMLWEKAMNEELEYLSSNDTFTYNLPHTLTCLLGGRCFSPLYFEAGQVLS